MLHFLRSPRAPDANWRASFGPTLQRGLDGLGVTTDWVELRDLHRLPASDHVFVLDYRDLDEPLLRACRAQLVMHANGTSACISTWNMDPVTERDQLSSIIDVTTVSLPSQGPLMQRVFPTMRPFLTIGFPLDFDRYRAWQGVSKQPNKIVVGGRITPDKQFLLGAFLLSRLSGEWNITFAVNDPDGSWTRLYDLPRFQRLGYRFVPCATSEAFYAELADASVFFTASLGDTSSLNIVEAALLSCYVVAPDIRDDFPLWMDYLSNGYEPFSRSSVEVMLRERPAQTVDLSWFDHRLVAERLAHGLAL